MKLISYKLPYLLIFLSPLIAHGQSIIGQYDFYKEDGVVYLNSNDELFTGIVEYRYSKDNIMQSQRVYQNGVLHGITNSWHLNGHASKSTTYENGKKNGLFRAWHKNGNLSYQGYYVGGKQNGVWQRWDASQNMISEKTYDANAKRRLVLALPKPPS